MGETTGTPTSKSNWNIGALSNSSSSVPGPGCIGLGRIESLDERTGAGRIRGEDGTTFRFFQAGVVDESTLQCGQAVEFIDSDGVATRIRSKIGAGSSLIGGVANSSSPIAHPAREMTGRVLDFDQRTGRGRIRGADDSSYSFYPAGVIGGSTLIAGQGVVFQESDGIATRIRAVSSTVEPSRTIGAVANSSSSQPSPGRPRRGAVQGFDSRTGMGKIIDEDQNTYRFFPAGVTDRWRPDTAPSPPPTMSSPHTSSKVSAFSKCDSSEFGRFTAMPFERSAFLSPLILLTANAAQTAPMANDTNLYRCGFFPAMRGAHARPERADITIQQRIAGETL